MDFRPTVAPPGRLVRLGVVVDTRNAPGRIPVSETLDWARTLLLLGVEKLDGAVTRDTLSLLLRYQQDIEKVTAELVLKEP